MADSSITLNPGADGAVIETDTTTGTGDHMQVVKPAWGAAGTKNLSDTATPFPVQTVAYTAGGCEVWKSLDIDETEEEIKATAGQVFGFFFGNMSGSTRYLKFFNATASGVVVGTASPPSVPVAVFVLPGNATDDVAGTVNFACPVQFDTAITVACTTGLADTDTGAPGANDVAIVVYYK